MVHENEIIMLTLGVGVLLFILANRSRLRHVPHRGVLLAAFGLMLAGWLLTVLEGFVLEDLLNVLEHVCYGIGSAALALWIVRSTRARDRGAA